MVRYGGEVFEWRVRKMLADFFKIKTGDILLFGITNKALGKHKFIVYLAKDNKLHVNAEFKKNKNDIYSCCKYYDRELCGSLEEYLKLTVLEIEEKAYGAFMDGAR